MHVSPFCRHIEWWSCQCQFRAHFAARRYAQQHLAPTCERGVIGQRARLLIGRSAQGILLRQHPHGRGSKRSGGWSRRWERQMKSAKRGSKRDQTHRRMTHGWYDAHKHLSQCRVTNYYKCAQTQEKGDVWGVLSTTVGCSRLPSAANDLATTN